LNLSNEESARRLRFLRREGGVEVFVDVETGEETYRGRSGPSHEMEPAIEARFQATVTSIDPLLTIGGPPRKLGWFERRRLARGIKELEAIAEGDRWRVWWFLGMARRSAGEADGALAAFERAHAANPSDVVVGRELGGQCLALGRGEQAVTVCARMCAVDPKDAGLRANLALAYMVAGDMARAKVEGTRALEMDPSDEITRRMVAMIDDVIAGKRPRPTTIT
jgi:tetratricopeptide (TPR) repeat protein